ncbi:hypothetical protein [Nostoc sp. FACHB-152]|uniref:hypothetical protein n=1 Tax=Nostoc sp. FACHB-152 TaxID=2692837 RepID=UPI0016887669|nr:hypothetical protein [Nostoc sp. FACHB-152]
MDYYLGKTYQKKQIGFSSPQIGYGVHTSLEILPNVWFRRLAFGFAIALEACHCEEERRRRKTSRRVAIALITGLCDDFAPLSLRS